MCFCFYVLGISPTTFNCYCFSIVVLDRPYIVGLNSNGFNVVRLLPCGNRKEEKTLVLGEVEHLAKSTKKGILFAASTSQLYCIRNELIRFECYNCGEPNNHFSKHCKKIGQQYNRCIECGNVILRGPASHKISCTNNRFVSTKIGEYELPFMEFHLIRFTFKNVEDVYCSESTAMDGVKTFLITKWFFLGTNIQLSRIYGQNDNVIVELKIKPSITLGLGRLDDSKHMASLMLCSNQIRINHYQHIDERGIVTYALSARPRTDATHDVEIKFKSDSHIILMALCWNNLWTANFAMNNKAVSIGGL